MNAPRFRVAAVSEGFDPAYGSRVPWLHHRKELARHGIDIEVHASPDGMDGAHDAMIPMVWLDFENPRRFDARRTMRFLERYSAYRARFPEVLQIVCNHIDMCRRPYALPYWRRGDPILCRTPPYDRSELDPFPASDIVPYEMVLGSERLRGEGPPTRLAGFVGTPTGPRGYRMRVAIETAKVGIGLCHPRPLAPEKYGRLLSECAILVCPRGWGEQSERHWDAWRAGKLVLTDTDCAAVEMIPGVRLEHEEHYLVYKDPAEIPDIVSEWSRPSRREDAERIARAGREAALSYDALSAMRAFFDRLRAEVRRP